MQNCGWSNKALLQKKPHVLVSTSLSVLASSKISGIVGVSGSSDEAFYVCSF